MRLPSFILSTTVATLLFLSQASNTVVYSQRLAQVLERIKVISDGGSTVGGYKHHKPQFQDPIIRSTDLVENALLHAYWIDFHEQFVQHEAFSKLVTEHPGITLRHEFWGQLNAVTVDVKDESALKDILDRIEGIKMVEPVVMHDRPEVYQTIQAIAKGGSREKKYPVHDFTGVKEVHESLKVFGNGIKIGIIDSGVDYTHPALGGCFGPGCKVAYGTDFVGDDGQSPDDDPKSDCDGHGTHVAGIIAANDTSFIGIAPQATLGAYRVFGCKGGTSNDLIMKALIRAASDGMQVINLSLGGPGGWRQDREARLADELAKNGTLIVAAMGNEGQMGLFESSSPGVAGSLITVASTENEFRSNLYFTIDQTALKNEDVSEDGEYASYSSEQDANEPGSDSQARPILFVGDVSMDLANTTLVQIAPGTSSQIPDDACKTISKDLKGKIALIRRGGCTFRIKLANAALANAAAAIIMDNVESEGFSADTEGSMIKVRTITRDDGEYLLKTIAKEKKEKEGIRLLPGDGPKKVYNPNGGFLSVFSSMGPDSELNSKPDIAAPGGQIWSTFPVKLGSYASLSGTSMATPYIVGCVALYLDGLPNADHSADAVKAAFQNSGQPRKQQKGFKGYASVTQQGAGLLNLMDALSTQAQISPSRISLNDTMFMNANQKFTITNNGQTPLQYKIDVIPAAGLKPFDSNKMVDKNPKAVEAKVSVKYSQRVVKVAPGSTTDVDLTFHGPKTNPADYIIYSGYVRFTPQKVTPKTPVVHVPYMGMQGDFKTVRILDTSFGVRIFDSRGRPLRSNSSEARGPPHVGVDGVVDKAGSINNEINADPTHGLDTPTGEPDPTADGRPRSQPNSMKVVFRMITGAEILVLDLVSDEGDDPYQVQSYGVLKNGVARYVPRNDQLEGNAFQVMGWDGQLLKEDGTTATALEGASGQRYRLRISLLKHFGNPENDQDFESHLSGPFILN
ncbi:hypothetical protein EMPS_00682 [Entomortierella parvispora]|uniref:Peptidase S8/S53 domain-containing protein n=1 Tax=Entomortierella parvispora TaxID=205924 RepID=A0A9P3LRT8_9FUNG|nr:hypothetical protein EMPS_00682 [Entomortierella parvispora]